MPQIDFDLARRLGYSPDIINRMLEIIDEERPNYFEIPYASLDSGVLPFSKALGEALPPTARRFGSYRGGNFAQYFFNEGASAEVIANTFLMLSSACGSKVSFQNRRGQAALPLEKLMHAIKRVQAHVPNDYPSEPDDETLNEYLLKVLEKLGAPEKTYKQVEVDGTGGATRSPDDRNTFMNLQSDGKPLGLVLPTLAVKDALGGNGLTPSLQLRSPKRGDQNVYFLMGNTSDLVDFWQIVVKAYDLPGEDDAGLMLPLPVGDFRLSTSSAEALQFDDRMHLFTPFDLCPLLLRANV